MFNDDIVRIDDLVIMADHMSAPEFLDRYMMVKDPSEEAEIMLLLVEAGFINEAEVLNDLKEMKSR